MMILRIEGRRVLAKFSCSWLSLLEKPGFVVHCFISLLHLSHSKEERTALPSESASTSRTTSKSPFLPYPLHHACHFCVTFPPVLNHSAIFPMHTRSIFYTVFIDIDLLTFVVSLLLTGLAHSVISGNQTIRPFYPRNAVLWNTFTKDTIQSSTLFILYYFILSPIIYVLELKNLSTITLPPRQKRILALRLAFGMWVATMIAIAATEFGKGYVGRLRPHFATTCLGPGPYPEQVLNEVILSDSDCPNPNKEALHDARRSFPSGHAALGLAGAAYAQLCLVRFAIRQEGVHSTIAMMAGWALVVFGGWVGASRIFDNAHHVSDVAVGSLAGLWASVIQFWLIVGRNSRIVAAAQRQNGKVE